MFAEKNGLMTHKFAFVSLCVLMYGVWLQRRYLIKRVVEGWDCYFSCET